jgi:hypothetical protein
MRLTRLLNIVPLLACGGCYTYAPIDSAAARPGMSVRARVSTAAAERLAPVLGTDSRLLTGTVMDASSESMLIEIPIVVPAAVGSSVQALHQRVTLARSDLVDLEARTLNRSRTGLLVGVAAVAVAGALKGALDNGPGLDRPPTGSGTDSRRPAPRSP